MPLLKISKKEIFNFIKFALFIFLLSAPLVWLSIQYPIAMKNVGNLITENALVLSVFRGILMVVLFFVFRPVVHKLGKKYAWPQEKISFWCAQRFKLILWLVIFELIICQNILLTFIQLIEK